MNKIFKIGLSASALFAGLVLIASAQSFSGGPRRQPETISFPVAELGNCGSQVECRAYCNQPANLQACTNFASEHHLISLAQREQNQKFAKAIKSGGPGGCQSLETCQAFCSQTSNFQTCAKFAKDNGLISGEDSQRIQKFNQLVQSGQTPGGCQSKDACESYCEDQSHKQECTDFAAKLGIISQSQAKKIKSISSGPGGCDSLDACQEYCNDPAHHDECLKFATDNGLIKPQDAEEITSAVDHMRNGLQNAPEIVKNCLEKNLGSDVFDQIESGQFTPTPAVGKQISACFAQSRPAAGQNSVGAPAMQKCLQEKFGGQSTDSVSSSSPEFQNAYQDCRQELEQNQGGENNVLPPPEPGLDAGSGTPGLMPPRPNMRPDSGTGLMPQGQQPQSDN